LTSSPNNESLLVKVPLTGSLFTFAALRTYTNPKVSWFILSKLQNLFLIA
jgi:hypothetical protein